MKPDSSPIAAPSARWLKCLSGTLLWLLAWDVGRAADIAAQGTLRADQPGAAISRYIFGQFAEHLGFGIYGGVWVGEDSRIPNTKGYRNDVLAALKRLEVPVVRWPGGCFADEYHWREGVGPRDKRPVRVNTHWGGIEETNAFGTHEFMNFAELIGADAYVSGNVGDGTPEEMAQWVEYMTSATTSTLANERRANGRDTPWKLPFFGIGNELWGCGGNMRAEYAADLTRRYQTFVKSPPAQNILKIASGGLEDDFHWTEVFMRETGKLMGGYSLHYYTSPGPNWNTKRSSTDFGEDQWIETLSKALRIEELITKHSALMDRFDPDKKVALVVDEWGTWYTGLPGVNPGFLHQQNSLRDALVAAIHINVFTQHADRVRMANIAQMVNVLQSMILTSGDRMVLTPTYYVFEMYEPFKNATHLPLEISAPTYQLGEYRVPSIHAAAARGMDGRLHIALTNLDPNHAARVDLKIVGVRVRSAHGRILTAGTINAINTFDEPEAVKPAGFTRVTTRSDGLGIDLPSKSVLVLDVD
jgi:alpha-N-arabinofuranosidase